MEKKFIALTVFLMVALMVPNVGFVRAQEEPSLLEVFNTLGFTNIIESRLEKFIPGIYNVTLYAEFAGYHDHNELSAYKCGTDLYQVLFYGYEGGYGYVNPPLEKQFTIDSVFGFSLISPTERYFTETSRNRDQRKHAVVYENLDAPGMYLIGWENSDGDFDYNDMVLSIELIRPITVNIDGCSWYRLTYNQDKVVLVLFGGVAYISGNKVTQVRVNPIYYYYEYNAPKMRFLLNLTTCGFDVLCNSQFLYYTGSENWAQKAAEWAKNSGYKDIYIFGFSAGGIVTAYEIQKEYATMHYSAAVVVNAPVDWDPYEGTIVHSADTAYVNKVSTCFLAGIEDPFYNQMRTYYLNTTTHKMWYDWENGHDIFPYHARDYPGLTVAQACINWFNENHPPNVPLKPSGPLTAYMNFKTEYSTATIDPNRQRIRYKFDWGDGSSSITDYVQSGATITVSHVWTKTGTYYVKVHAQDESGLWSYQSPQIEVTVKKLYVNLTLSIPQAPAQGYDTDGTPREPVSIWVDGVEYKFFANTKVVIQLEAGVPHTLKAQASFIKEEWMPGYYYIYRFLQWSDGITSNPRTITLTSNLTLAAYYIRSKFAITSG